MERDGDEGGGGGWRKIEENERAQITPNKRVSRFVSVVFNTDKQIERIFITFPGHSGPNNYRPHRIFVPGMSAGPAGGRLPSSPSHFRGSPSSRGLVRRIVEGKKKARVHFIFVSKKGERRNEDCATQGGRGRPATFNIFTWRGFSICEMRN